MIDCRTGGLRAAVAGICLAAFGAAGMPGAVQAAVVTGVSRPVEWIEFGPYITGIYPAYDEVLVLSVGSDALADAAFGPVVVPPVRELRLSYDIDLTPGTGLVTSYATDGSFSISYTAGPGGFVLNDNRGTPMAAMKGPYSIDADSIVVTEFVLYGAVQAPGSLPDFSDVGMSFRKNPVLFPDEKVAGRWTRSPKSHQDYLVPLPASGLMLVGAIVVGMGLVRRRAA